MIYMFLDGDTTPKEYFLGKNALLTLWTSGPWVFGPDAKRQPSARPRRLKKRRVPKARSFSGTERRQFPTGA